MALRPSKTTDAVGWRSIEVKLPVVVSGLLLVSIGIAHAAAFLQVRRATLAIAAERLEIVLQQLSRSLGSTANQLKTRLIKQGSDSAFVAYLARKNGSTRAAALHALEWGHYFGAPCFVPRLTTGRWIFVPQKGNMALTDHVVRKYYVEEAPEVGTYSFYLARRV